MDFTLMHTNTPPVPHRTRRLCAAPMMERSDRHLNRLLRLISPRIWLFTEMIPTGALLHADNPERYAPSAPGCALQIGGAEPADVAACAEIAETLGFEEINLNVGCPSDRVAAGAFGASLMYHPERVAELVAAMRARCAIDVTVKCRLGVDDQDTEETLDAFLSTVADAGCTTFYVHARKAQLAGLSPKQNRNIPPLQYARVWKLKQDFPHLTIIINGGIRDAEIAQQQIAHVDGVMIGRMLTEDPWQLRALEAVLFEQASSPQRNAVLAAYLDYAEERIGAGDSAARVLRPVSGLFAGEPGAKAWRTAVAEGAPVATLRTLGAQRAGRGEMAHNWQTQIPPDTRGTHDGTLDSI